MGYQYLYNGKGERREDVILKTPGDRVVPKNEQNREWKLYQLWLREGNVPEEPSIEYLRKLMKIRLYIKRNEIINSGFLYNNNIYFSDDQSQITINNALSTYERGFNNIFPADWILKDGTTYNISYEEMKSLSGELADYLKLAFINYVRLMRTLSTSSDPKSIDINEGWPV